MLRAIKYWNWFTLIIRREKNLNNVWKVHTWNLGWGTVQYVKKGIKGVTQKKIVDRSVAYGVANRDNELSLTLVQFLLNMK